MRAGDSRPYPIPFRCSAFRLVSEQLNKTGENERRTGLNLQSSNAREIFVDLKLRRLESSELESKRVGEHARVVRSSHRSRIPESFSRSLRTKNQQRLSRKSRERRTSR